MEKMYELNAKVIVLLSAAKMSIYCMRNDCNNKKLFTEIKWYIHAMAVRYGQLVNHLFYHRNAFKTVRKF